jgi:hypothetical protein
MARSEVSASASVISSGDDENYAHPRPDVPGAFGKYSRGRRPLIFSNDHTGGFEYQVKTGSH